MISEMGLERSAVTVPVENKLISTLIYIIYNI